MIGKTRSELYGGEISVSIGDQQERLPEAKESVPWLQEVQKPVDMLPAEEIVFSVNTLPNVVETVTNKDKKMEIASMLMECEAD